MDVDSIVAGFRDHTLAKVDWTHEAHLTVCWAALRTMTVAAAIDDLRAAIRAYNTAVGTPNTETSGYHETLTRYYVGAVAHARSATESGTLAGVLAHPACGRRAPFGHWSRERLMTPAARLAWLPPDLAPLPFALPES